MSGTLGMSGTFMLWPTIPIAMPNIWTLQSLSHKTRLSHPRFASAAMICNGLQLLARRA